MRCESWKLRHGRHMTTVLYVPLCYQYSSKFRYCDGFKFYELLCYGGTLAGACTRFQCVWPFMVLITTFVSLVHKTNPCLHALLHSAVYMTASVVIGLDSFNLVEELISVGIYVCIQMVDTITHDISMAAA